MQAWHRLGRCVFDLRSDLLLRAKHKKRCAPLSLQSDQATSPTWRTLQAACSGQPSGLKLAGGRAAAAAAAALCAGDDLRSRLMKRADCQGTFWTGQRHLACRLG